MSQTDLAALLADRILNADVSDERAQTFIEVLTMGPFSGRELLSVENVKLALAAADDPETVGAFALAIEERGS